MGFIDKLASETDTTAETSASSESEFGWGKFEITLPSFDPLEKLSDIIDKLREILEIVVTALEAFLNFLAAFADPIAALIQEIIDAIVELLEGLLRDAGIYLFYVPFAKKLMTNFAGIGDFTPESAEWLFGGGIGPEPDETPSQEEERERLSQFLTNINRYSGGNYGFFRTVWDSLYDEGDLSRPMFYNENDYVAGWIFMIGTDFDPIGFLDDLWRLFGIFGSLFGGIPGMPENVPVPKNLTATALSTGQAGTYGTSTGSFDVLLEWDGPGTLINQIGDLGNVILTPTETAIIRVKNNPNAMVASNIVELVGTRNLTEGLTKGATGYEIEVVKILDKPLVKTSYVDKDVPLDDTPIGDSYFYAVAWKLDAYESRFVSEDEEPQSKLDYWLISNVARCTPQPAVPASVRPDWLRTPSLASLFPPLEEFIARVIGYLRTFENIIKSVIDQYKAYIEFLKSEVQRYEKLVSDILDAIEKLAELLKVPEITGGVYYRPFYGLGGNNFFVQDLLASLTVGEEDPNAPPFLRGDEWVTGFILMAGGPKPQVDAFRAALGLILGTTTPGGLSDMLEGLGDAVQDMEEACFGEDMGEANCQEEAEQIFSDSLEDITDCSDEGAAATAVSATFGPDMQPIVLTAIVS
jgi:hypothetical protein